MFAREGFVHLDVRSYFSLKDGAASPEAVALRAAELGMPAVALTDRDGLYGAARFVSACGQVGVRPILGATLTLRERSPGTSPGATDRGTSPGATDHPSIVVLARDATGYANLCRLITDAHMLGERGDPSLDVAQLLAHPSGLVCLLGPDSHVARLSHDAAVAALGPFKEAFGDRLFVSVRNRLEPWSTGEIRRMLRLAADAGVRAVATNGVRYLARGDAFLADALECMREIVPVNAGNVTRTNAEGYLKPAAEMRALFAERPDLCDAALEIAESCSFALGLKQVHFPDFPTPAGRSATSLLAERCRRGFEDRGLHATREVQGRLDNEIDMIHKLGYSAYFLTVADICADVRAMGVRTACRGSAAGSLVCYLTRISDVDPVHHDLLFERFLNPLRDELPDIDIDVESARREDVYDMILSRYGDDRAACVCMVDTYRARGAIREVGKALGLPDVEIDTVAKAFPMMGAGNIRAGIERLPELRGSNIGAGQLELLFRVAERLDGVPRHIALHPSGIVLSRNDLVERVPLERSFQGYRMIQADKDDVELLGYLKLDVLGVRMLSSMRHCLDEIARTEHEKVDLDAIPLDDAPTFDLIRRSDTIGCFQIESPGQRELLQKLQPTAWEDLIVDISLFRPGPVKSDMVTPYIKRRHGWDPPSYVHPDLRPALQETFGVIVYHEQVIRTFAILGGYSLPEADRIRRHLDHDPEDVHDIRSEFIPRLRARGLSEPEAERIWKELFAFAAFGFCKSHAAAFAVPTYQSAWLKAHYPAHFLAGVLTHEPGMYPRRLFLEDAREHGVPILPLDVNVSEPEYVVERVGAAAQVGSLPSCSDRDFGKHRGGCGDLDDAREGPLPARPAPLYGIRLALKDVHGISDAEIRSILQARSERPFADVGDFLRRASVSQPTGERLAHAGAFDSLPGGTRRDRLYAAMTATPQREGDQLALNLWEGPRVSPAHPGDHRVLREYSDAERVRAELEVIGVDASRHILSFYEPLLQDLGVVRSRDLADHRTDEWVMVAGVKVSSQTPQVRSKQRIIFLTLDDATGPVDVTVFERIQPKCAKTIFHGFVLAVWGRLRRTGLRGVSIIAEDVWDLAEVQRAHLPGRARSLPPVKMWHASGGSAGW
ncbi:MAG: DNA polymerase III subunit alpha [Actinomycetota bacterium]